MKKAHILTVFALSIIGALLGASLGVNPYVAGGTIGSVVATTSMVKSPGVHYNAGIDLTAIVGQVDLYMRKYSTEIWTKVKEGLDFEAYMKKIPNITGEYISTNSSRTDMLQAWQKGFQAKGSVALTPYKNTVHRMKIDYLLDDMDLLFPTYQAQLVDEKTTPDKYPFVKWLVDYHIVPGAQEEINKISVKGVRVNPTAGTAGNSINVTNGVFTKITTEIAASNLVPIVTGAITASNVVDKIESFHRLMPERYREMPGKIFAAASLVENYKYNYREKFGTNQDFNGPTVKLWGTNKELVGISQNDGSSRLLFTPSGPTGNLLCMYDQLMGPKLTVQLDKRDVIILGDMHRGYGFNTLNEVFVNDQA